MQTVKFAILTCEWKTKAANAVAGPAWTADLLRKVFQDRNGWSLGHWWDDCSLGHRKLEFEVFDLGLLDAVQGTLSDTDLRDRVVELARVRGVPLSTYGHHVVFVDPPPNAAFQYRGSAIADRTAPTSPVTTTSPLAPGWFRASIRCTAAAFTAASAA